MITSQRIFIYLFNVLIINRLLNFLKCCWCIGVLHALTTHSQPGSRMSEYRSEILTPFSCITKKLYILPSLVHSVRTF